MNYTAQDGYVYIHKINKDIYGKTIVILKNDNIDNYIEILETAIDPPVYEEPTWHENTTYQIKMSFKNNLLLLQQYPEFGTYIKDNCITTYIETVNNYVYIYVNFIIPEHEYLLTMFGAIITNRIINL